MKGPQLLEELRSRGVLAGLDASRRMRLVTNRHHTPEIITEAVERISQVFC